MAALNHNGWPDSIIFGGRFGSEYAFDISIVNKKFYAEIKAIFDALTKEELPKCKGILTDERDRVQFAIRLIGRIIFCWFLKRKGIVADNVMSSGAVQRQQNYYRDLLEPLFFDVFNTPLNDRRKDLPDLIRNYPFLNGGLFDPQPHDYKDNWALNIPNDWFIDFFGNTLERYNFTVDENSAASSEIAIDPEMLGRIFENLLAEQNPETGESARKATGSYYTPREIVDFMVEESLIAYLKTLKSSGDEPVIDPLSNGAQPMSDQIIEDFVHTGILPDALRPNSEELLDKLNIIKVLDPACGSGAFPISMLQKLVGLKQQLDPRTSPYQLKLKTIENSIYGVDIQPMATELSRLRCWLSLIVDEDPKDIKPLPNLDFKFVTANSLIDLGYDEFIQKVQTGKVPPLFLTNFIKDLESLKEVRHKYFEPTLNHGDKNKLKKEFNAISSDLFNMSLELIKQGLLDVEFANRITGWDLFDDSKPAPFFNKSWMFGIEDGFDVVIANPPWGAKFSSAEKAILKENYPEIDSSTPNSFAYFLGLAKRVSKGIVSYVLPDSILIKDFAKTRKLLKPNLTILNWYQNIGLPDNLRPFIYVEHDVCVLFFDNKETDRLLCSKFVYDPKEKVVLQNKWIAQKSEMIFEEFDYAYNLMLREKDLAILKKLNKFKPISSYLQCHEGIHTGNARDSLFKKTRENKWCKPLYYGAGAGDKINNYASERNGWFVDYRKELIDKNKGNYASLRDERIFIYPKIYITRTGNPFKAFLDLDSYASNNFFSLQFKDYSQNKIDGLKIVLLFINSSITQYFIRTFAAPRLGSTFVETKIIHLLKLKIPEINKETREQFLIKADQIFATKQNDSSVDTSDIEREIAVMIYKLYNLTPEEIEIVEGRDV